MPEETLQILQNRYILEDVLGVGGMGVVYKARDRLEDNTVALKRIHVPLEALRFASRGGENQRKVVLYALTREFQMLSSLRHPHIIRVLDYGFDEEQNPFLTMDLLSDAKEFMLASLRFTMLQKVHYLIQVLQALAYLHQRGILHRDLKPSNVLVAQEKAYLLDFGLSVERGQGQGRAGTMAYMAPEIVRGGEATIASDLYSLGVMAYEIFAEDVPFEPMDVMGIISGKPDMSKVNAPEDVQLVIERLLLKMPKDRYKNAEAVIRALCDAADLALPKEDPTIQESYLQAARFVGREEERQRLTSALETTKDGRGSIWLIGGESGVGKSRLVNEIRTQALLRGIQVVRGQEVSGNGLPLQIWRSPMRWMSLYTPLSDVEAGILKEIVPDLERLLERPIANLPRLDGTAHHQRLRLTMLDVLKRQNKPLLILLEDLQWSEEGIDILQKIQEEIKHYPLCVIGTYRSDERPNLPDEIPHSVQIQLERLKREDILSLSASMIGEAAAQPQVVELLEQETEGNVYFLVEVIRALAEEAGGLHRIGQKTLPANVFVGGIAAVLRRRLSKIPEAMREILHLAAVIGREVDVPLLDHLAQRQLVDDWLNIAANAAVLDVQDNHWHFAHDKLRELLLSDIDAAQLKALHQRVAEVIEAVYPNDDDYTGKLAQHWHEAGNVEKAVFYGLRQARRLLLMGQTRSLMDLCLRLSALDGITDSDRSPLYRLLGDAYQRTGDYPAARLHQEKALELAQRVGDADTAVYAIKGLATLAWFSGDIAAAEKELERALPFEKLVKDTGSIAEIVNNLGVIARSRGATEEANLLFTQALDLHRTGNSPNGLATTLFNVADGMYRIGEKEAAKQYYQEIAETSLAIGNLPAAANAYGELGNCHYLEGAYPPALAYFAKELDLQKKVENVFAVSLNYLNQANVYDALQDSPACKLALHTAASSLRHSSFTILQLQAILTYGRFLVAEKRAIRAAELLGFVNNHEQGSFSDLQPYRDGLAALLKKHVTPFLLANALETGKRNQMEAIFTEMLDLTKE